MRNAFLLGLAAAVTATGLSLGVAAGGGRAASKPGLAAAIERTAHVRSARYAIDVRLASAGSPMTLHIRGQESAQTVSVAMRLGDLRLADGTTLPGPDGAAVIDGPYLYERAPSSVVVNGKIRWLRLPLAKLSQESDDLQAVRAMTPEPLLHLLAGARLVVSGTNARAYHGTIAYDQPAARGLSKLTGGLEFRGLRVSALLGRDGLVHRIVLTGRTADRKTTFSLRAHLYGFDRPLHVTPPKPGTFMDTQLAELPA